MGWALVDDGLRFSVHQMIGEQIAKGATGFSGVWAWIRRGERIASIGYTVSLLSPSSALLTLTYRHNDEDVSYGIRLIGKPCRFGGRQWFATCPHTGLTVAKLYKPCGAKRFFARKAWRLAYRSQRSSGIMERALRRRDRILVCKLKSDDPFMPIKPKWMRQKTYAKWVNALNDAEEAFDRAFAARFGGMANIWGA